MRHSENDVNHPKRALVHLFYHRGGVMWRMLPDEPITGAFAGNVTNR